MRGIAFFNHTNCHILRKTIAYDKTSDADKQNFRSHNGLSYAASANLLSDLPIEGEGQVTSSATPKNSTPISRTMPLTHFDRIRKLRPEMWDYLAHDIAQLRNIGWQGSIGSVDDFGSQSFEPCINFLLDKFIQDTAAKVGIPAVEMSQQFKHTADFQLLLNGLCQDYHNLLNFELAGRKTFYFNDGLADHLLATELGVEAELVRPPFDSCLFVLSSPAAIDAAYAAIRQTPDFETYQYPISVFVASLPDKANPAWRKILMAVSHWQGPRLVFVMKREVAIRPGWKIDDALRTDWEALGEEVGGGIYLSNNGASRETKDEEFYTDGLSLFRLVLNGILYLGSSDPDIIQRFSGREAALDDAATIKSHVKAKKARQEARKESALDFASVGESVKPIYVRKGKPGKGESTGGFCEYAVRFVVRGHWRNQPFGPELTERRLVWIKPYYKGPEMAELVNRPYVVS